MKKILCAVISLLTIGTVNLYAQDTDISSYPNLIYIESGITVSLDENGNAVIPINMKNSVESTGYQFDLTLPDEISADDVLLAKTNDRKSEDVSFNYAKQSEHVHRAVCYTTDDKVFDGEDGTVATMTIAGLVPGSYTFTMTNTIVTCHGVDYKEAGPIVATVNVEALTYAEGYSVQMLPFLLADEMEVSFLVSNQTDLTNVEFDVVLPQTLVDNELYYTDVVLAKTKFTTTLSQNSDGTEHVSIARRSSNKIVADDNFAVATLGLVYDEVVADGVYPILIQNITLTDVDGIEFKAAPFTASMIVGQYEREMTSTWGTICLPYNTVSDENVQIYELTEADLENGVLSFSPVDELTANTPAVFKRLGDKAIFAVASADEAVEMECVTETNVAGWSLKATYATKDVDPSAVDADIYYIAQNKFWYANMTFTSAPFRAWFETPKTAGASVSRFEIVEQENVTGVDYLEQEDGSVKVVFDLNGRRQNNVENNSVNIVNGKTVLVK